MTDIESTKTKTGVTNHHHPDFDQIVQTMLESIDPIREIAKTAYDYAQTEDLSIGLRRSLERLGIRATDLIIELAAFVQAQQ